MGVWFSKDMRLFQNVDDNESDFSKTLASYNKCGTHHHCALYALHQYVVAASIYT